MQPFVAGSRPSVDLQPRGVKSRISSADGDAMPLTVPPRRILAAVAAPLLLAIALLGTPPASHAASPPSRPPPPSSAPPPARHPHRLTRRVSPLRGDDGPLPRQRPARRPRAHPAAAQPPAPPGRRGARRRHGRPPLLRPRLPLLGRRHRPRPPRRLPGAHAGLVPRRGHRLGRGLALHAAVDRHRVDEQPGASGRDPPPRLPRRRPRRARRRAARRRLEARRYVRAGRRLPLNPPT